MARSYGCSRVIHTSQGSSASLIIEFIYRLYISVQMSISSLLHQPSTVTIINFASAGSVSYSQYHVLFPSQVVDHIVHCYKYTISSYPLITGPPNQFVLLPRAHIAPFYPTSQSPLLQPPILPSMSWIDWLIMCSSL
jgi:hypothetical protein